MNLSDAWHIVRVNVDGDLHPDTYSAVEMVEHAIKNLTNTYELIKGISMQCKDKRYCSECHLCGKKGCALKHFPSDWDVDFLNTALMCVVGDLIEE